MLEAIHDGGIFQRIYEKMKEEKRFVIFSVSGFVTIQFKISYKWEGHTIRMNDVHLECEDGVLHIGWREGRKNYESTFDLNNYNIQSMSKLLDDVLDSIPSIVEQKNNIEILNNEKASSEEKLKALESYTASSAFLDKLDEFSKNEVKFLTFIYDAAALANLSLDEFYAALFL